MYMFRLVFRLPRLANSFVAASTLPNHRNQPVYFNHVASQKTRAEGSSTSLMALHNQIWTAKAISKWLGVVRDGSYVFQQLDYSGQCASATVGRVDHSERNRENGLLNTIGRPNSFHVGDPV